MEQNHIALFPVVGVHELCGVEPGESSRGAADQLERGEINVPEVQFQAAASYTPSP
jgi:hypothetical protein